MKRKEQQGVTPASSPIGGELILYQTPEGTVRIEVLYESETFWLDQRKIAELFGAIVPTVNYHLREVYDSSELRHEATIRRILRVASGSQIPILEPALS